MEKTIVAISTPVGVGGISIVRMSGPKAKEIALRIFCPLNSKQELSPRTMVIGKVSAGDINDKCLCVYFQSPNSYTGEDIVEFQVHGGIVIANNVLSELLKNGASMAEPGEFTKRAFVNGKLSLDEAEGVIDMINAESESEVKAGYNLLNGELHKTVSLIQKQITDTLAKIEVTLDYPEHDIEEQTTNDIKDEFLALQGQLRRLSNSTGVGRLIKSGVKVAIVGKPNAGKSSLMNAMLNYDRAIVTDIKGTTRDTIEETYLYNGVKFVLVDTAGVRESTDLVEKIGIDKSIKTMEESDIVLLVLDNTTCLSQEDMDIYSRLIDKKYIVVVNKVDEKGIIDLAPIKVNIVKISAKDIVGIDELKQSIYNLMIDQGVIGGGLIITNERHKNILDKALIKVGSVIDAINNGYSLDLVSIDISELWQILGEITGETNNELIIESIFKNFCVGK